MWLIKTQRDISAAEVLLKKWKVPAPNWAHRSGPSARKSSLWKPPEVVADWDGGLLESKAFLLKGPHTDLLANGLALSFSAVATTQKVPGRYRKELNSLVPTALSQTHADRCHCTFADLSPHPAQRHRLKCSQEPLFLCWVISPHRQQVGTKSEQPLTWVMQLAPALVIPWDPSPPPICSRLEPFSAPVTQNQLALASTAALPKRPQNQHTCWLASDNTRAPPNHPQMTYSKSELGRHQSTTTVNPSP